MTDEITATKPTAGYSVKVRVEIENRPGMLGKIASAIGEVGGDIGEVSLVKDAPGKLTRDFTVKAGDATHAGRIADRMRGIEGIQVLDVTDRTFALHNMGKIEVRSKIEVHSLDDLAMAYTPGVGRVCMEIYAHPERAYDLTIKQNTVAVVSDGTAVLGLGDIGPSAAQPVMEGKALIFREFAGINAFPICLDTKDVDEIVAAVKAIAPVFGGINLEDISAPRCFEIEERCQKELDIPIFHDDQHGTAVVVLAALHNALKITGKHLEDVRIVMMGTGASGIAVAKLLILAGAKHIVSTDRAGTLYKGRTENMNSMKEWFAENSNFEGLRGSVTDALRGADVLIGLSGPGLIKASDLAGMAKDAIVFAMANPVPEIMPEEAAPYVRIMATGRSDYANQINNSACFPGFFRGMLDVRASRVNDEMKLAASYALAGLVSESELSEEYITPSMFDPRVMPAVSDAVARAAISSGVARIS